jgi:hypothetical protein
VHPSLTLRGVLAFAVVLAVPSIAYANTGIPMLVLVLPAGILALPIVIVLEGSILQRRLGMTRARSLKLSGVANAWSTLIGIPVAWFVLVMFEMLGGAVVWRVVVGENVRHPQEFWQDILIVIWSAPWLVPIREEPTPWILPVATLVLLVPFFFASYLVEMHVIRRALPDVDAPQVRDATWRANVATYTLFALTTLVWLGWMHVSGAA